MEDVYKNLVASIKDKNSENIIKNLKIILSNQNVDYNNVSVLNELLNFDNNDVLRLTSQTIAESCKSATNRKILSDKDIIETLFKVFSTNKNVLCLTQVCRALGNLCYENDDARSILNKNDGVKMIINVLETCLSVDDSSNTQLMKVTCGLLFNYLISNEDAQKKAYELKVYNIIEKIVRLKIDCFSTYEDLFIHLLHVLSVLTEQFVDTWFSNEFIINLVKILEMSINPEISEFCLELLQGQAENDEIKLLLAEKGLCELLFNLLEQHKSLVSDEESRALLKQACDLIVLILTGDISMTFLYSEGNGKVYKDMISWLCSDDIDLMITGVLAIGNFARNDKHCIKMVQDGVSEKLLEMLSKHNNITDDIRLQHALLSALRNLTIPVQNKSKMIDLGLVEVIYPMLLSEQYPVIFKLLGTLRMVIDGQEKMAQKLIMKEDLLERLVNFCLNSDHPGVRAESPRLLAWLIKHCHSSESYPKLISVKDCVRCLVEMIPSSHGVMQNEAIYALNILCAFESLISEKEKKTENVGDCVFEDLVSENVKNNDIAENIRDLNINNRDLNIIFVDCDIGKYLAFLLTKYGEKMEKEIIENMVLFLEKLSISLEVKQNLKKNEVNVFLKKILDRNDCSGVFQRVNNICHSIESI